jgi:hypothetical protein
MRTRSSSPAPLHTRPASSGRCGPTRRATSRRSSTPTWRSSRSRYR